MSMRLRIRCMYAGLIASVAAGLAACGGGGYSGGGSNNCGPGYGQPCPTSPPSITLASVAGTVNRTVTLTATPTAANGVMRVDFLVDNANVGMATTSPYTFAWDTSTVADGSHSITARVTDNQSQTATSAATTVTVANNVTIQLELSPSKEYPAPISTASGAGQLVVNVATGAISGSFTVTGITATAAHIHDGYAGKAGPVIVPFAANAANANLWELASGVVLTAPQLDRLNVGALYVNVHSAAYPTGELRDQIKPTNIKVVYAPMSGDQEVPPVITTATGVAAVTVDTAASQVSVHLNSTGTADSTLAHLHRGTAGVTGAPFVSLDKDPNNSGHWSAEAQTITAGDITDFNNNGWYANIHTPANPNGEIRGQIQVTQSAPATTLAQLQNNIFTPHCAVCHTGGGASLPSSMNLTTAANTYAALVGVNSVEQSTLLRVAPNDPAASYLIRKLEGAASISGSRMPLGGPFLVQSEIDTVKSWITSGAPNN